MAIVTAGLLRRAGAATALGGAISGGAPLLQPFGMAGQAFTVQFRLDRSAFSYFNDGEWVVAPGTYTVSVRTSADRLSGLTQLTLSSDSGRV